MIMKMSTTLGRIDKIPNPDIVILVKNFHEYLKEIGLLKAIKIRI